MMNSTWRNRWVALLLAVMAVAALRFAWWASRTEVGWSLAGESLCETLGKPFGFGQRAIGDWDPADQARYWLAVVDRTPATRQQPQLAIGAAWMLDTPGNGFQRRHIVADDVPRRPEWPGDAPKPVQVDKRAIAALLDEFELLTADRCLDLAQRATELEPDNPEWWRARALLQMRCEPWGLELLPRRDDWLETLDACAAHDPDNALYDYLAAVCLWAESAERGWNDQVNDDSLAVFDKAKFDMGCRRFEAGQVKPHLKFGDTSWSAALAFLRASHVPAVQWVPALENRAFSERMTSLLVLLFRWESARRGEMFRKGEVDSAIARIDEQLRVADQISEEGNLQTVAYLNALVRRLTSVQQIHLAQQRREIDKAEATQRSDAAQAELERIQQISSLVWALDTPDALFALRNLAVFTLGQSAVWLAVAAGLVTLVAWLIGLRTGQTATSLGFGPAAIVWLLPACATFVVLGMFPAGMVSGLTQARMVVAVLSLLTTVLVSLNAVWLVRSWKVSVVHLGALVLTGLYIMQLLVLLVSIDDWSNISPVVGLGIVPAGIALAIADGHFLLRSTLSWGRRLIVVAATLSCAVLIAATGLAWMLFNRTAAPPPLLPAILPNEFGNLVPTDARQLFGLVDQSWRWAMVQWWAYHGGAVTAVLACFALFTWEAVRARDGSGRSRTSAALSTVGRSLAFVAALCLLGWFVTMPSVMVQLDQYHQVRLQLMTEPQRAWEAYQALLLEVEQERDS